jgi:hypothetical protein
MLAALARASAETSRPKGAPRERTCHAGARVSSRRQPARHRDRRGRLRQDAHRACRPAEGVCAKQCLRTSEPRRGVIFDNCEHVKAEVAALARVLLRGWRAAADPHRSGAKPLFAKRAQAVDRGFALGPDR